MAIATCHMASPNSGRTGRDVFVWTSDGRIQPVRGSRVCFKQLHGVAHEEPVLVLVSEYYFVFQSSTARNSLSTIPRTEKTTSDADEEEEEELVGNAVECEMVKHTLLVNGLDFEREPATEEVAFFESTDEPRDRIMPDGQKVEANRVIFRTVRSFEFDQHIQLQSCVVTFESRYLDAANKATDKQKIKRAASMLGGGGGKGGGGSVSVIFTKGSFERVAGRCRPETLPEEYDSITKELASGGYYVLGIGMRVLKESPKVAQRQDMEDDLTFIGLLLFKNELKKDTPAAIEELKKVEKN